MAEALAQEAHALSREPLFCYLSNVFGVTSVKTYQQEAISNVLHGKDCSGNGKSLIYQALPYASSYKECGAVPTEVKQLVLVVSPLIALMEEQVKKLEKRGVPSICLSNDTV